MTSGTLAYSFGLGKAVVSTPYWHAQELLADGRGVLVPFGDAAAIGSEIAGLLTDEPRRQAMRKRAYSSSRSMTWERTAERYLARFERARRAHRLRVVARLDQNASARTDATRRRKCRSVIFCPCATIPACFSMPSIRCRTVPTAIASTTMPARCCWLARSTTPVSSACPKPLTARLAAFVQHAWNPGHEAVSQLHELRANAGSKTAARRTAMGVRSGRWASAHAAMPVRRADDWAASLFAEALPASEELSLAPRLGLHPARPGRLLRRRSRGFLGRASPAGPCRQADVHPVGGRDPGLGVVRGRARL